MRHQSMKFARSTLRCHSINTLMGITNTHRGRDSEIWQLQSHNNFTNFACLESKRAKALGCMCVGNSILIYLRIFCRFNVTLYQPNDHQRRFFCVFFLVTAAPWCCLMCWHWSAWPTPFSGNMETWRPQTWHLPRASRHHRRRWAHPHSTKVKLIGSLCTVCVDKRI